MKSMLVFGTRPEAIKMAPIYFELVRRCGRKSVLVCVTGQHREMLDQVLELFGIEPDYDLRLMSHDQSLGELTARAVQRTEEVVRTWKPDMLLVQGDTTTCFCAALAAFYAKTPVGHVEAGLRTGNIHSPWPEEANRRMVSSLAALHFAPTPQSRDNLLAENVRPETVHVTGNTVIDALLDVAQRVSDDGSLASELRSQFDFLDPAKHLVLATGHRRENFGRGIENICNALTDLAARDDVQVVYPVHLNPNIRDKVHALLSGKDDLFLIEPQQYIPFVYLMRRSHLILTDSGGVQEEAPSLGKPVLVMRDNTERPEGVAAGTVRLVGTDRKAIVSAANSLLDDPAEYARMVDVHNPYGDGKSAARIVDIILKTKGN